MHAAALALLTAVFGRMRCTCVPHMEHFGTRRRRVRRLVRPLGAESVKAQSVSVEGVPVEGYGELQPDSLELTLTWPSRLASQHPEAQAKMQKEIDEVLGDRIPTYEDMRSLEQCRLVVTETLRLFPEPPLLIRRALEADTLPRGHGVPGLSLPQTCPAPSHARPVASRARPRVWGGGGVCVGVLVCAVPACHGGRACVNV